MIVDERLGAEFHILRDWWVVVGGTTTLARPCVLNEEGFMPVNIGDSIWVEVGGTRHTLTANKAGKLNGVLAYPDGRVEMSYVSNHL
jgi:hypothetical protein